MWRSTRSMILHCHTDCKIASFFFKEIFIFVCKTGWSHSRRSWDGSLCNPRYGFVCRWKPLPESDRSRHRIPIRSAMIARRGVRGDHQIRGFQLWRGMGKKHRTIFRRTVRASGDVFSGIWGNCRQFSPCGGRGGAPVISAGGGGAVEISFCGGGGWPKRFLGRPACAGRSGSIG